MLAYPDDPDYEPIYAALFELTAAIRWGTDEQPGLYSFKTRSRRLRLFNEVPTEEQPAIFQTEHDEDEAPKTGTPGRVTLSASWFIYFNLGPDKRLVPAIDANKIMAGVRRVLRPLPQDEGFCDRRLTLGGKVRYARIEGKVFKDPGDLDDQGLLIVPIKLLVP